MATSSILEPIVLSEEGGRILAELLQTGVSTLPRESKVHATKMTEEDIELMLSGAREDE